MWTRSPGECHLDSVRRKQAGARASGKAIPESCNALEANPFPFFKTHVHFQKLRVHKPLKSSQQMLPGKNISGKWSQCGPRP